MIIEPTIINLLPEFFGDREHILVEHGSLKAATFRYQNGVCALRLETDYFKSYIKTSGAPGSKPVDDCEGNQ